MKTTTRLIPLLILLISEYMPYCKEFFRSLPPLSLHFLMTHVGVLTKKSAMSLCACSSDNAEYKALNNKCPRALGLTYIAIERSREATTSKKEKSKSKSKSKSKEKRKE